MNLPETDSDVSALKELLQVKYSQLNALLEATKAINDAMAISFFMAFSSMTTERDTVSSSSAKLPHRR